MKILMKLLMLLAFSSNSFTAKSQCACNPNQSDSFWHIGYNNSRRVSDCANSSACYNCHGFVMSYFEKGCKPGMYSFYNPPYTCPASQGIESDLAWKTNSKYLKVCNEGNADIVYYPTIVPGGHSAVKIGIENNVFRYISKYGDDGPLVNHNLTGTYYHAENQVNGPNEYYIYTGAITGNTNIVGTGNKTFSVLNKPGVTYYWFITGSNAVITGSNNKNSVTITPTHSGTVKLTLRTSSSCSGGYKEQHITLNIQTNICLEGTYSDANGGGKNLYTTNNVPAGYVTESVTCPNATSYIWQRTSGSLNYYANGSNLSFTMTSGNSISFNVQAKNGSIVLANRSITFYNNGSFLIYPNPASESFQIAVKENESYFVIIYDQDKNILKKEVSYSYNSKIDVSSLKPGNYFIEVLRDKEVLHQGRIQIAR